MYTVLLQVIQALLTINNNNMLNQPDLMKYSTKLQQITIK